MQRVHAKHATAAIQTARARWAEFGAKRIDDEASGHWVRSNLSRSGWDVCTHTSTIGDAYDPRAAMPMASVSRLSQDSESQTCRCGGEFLGATNNVAGPWRSEDPVLLGVARSAFGAKSDGNVEESGLRLGSVTVAGKLQ